MRCPKCDTEILDNSKVCPNCKTYLLKDDDLNIELPMMKNAPKEEPIEEIKEDPQDTKEIVLDYENPKEELVIEAANENIDAISDTDADGVSSPTVNNILEYEPDLPEEEPKEEINIEQETIKVKKHYLFVCSVVGLVLLLALLCGLTLLRGKNINKYDFKSELSQALTNYYNSNGEDYNSLNTVLEHVYKEENKLDVAREETYHQLDEWVAEYLNYEAKNAAEFSNATSKYRKIINNIYEKVEINGAKLVEEDKYQEYLNKIESISTDSRVFYKALDFYNNNDFNEAYKIFSSIDDSNVYHQKAEEYKTKITNTVISYIKKDITPLEVEVEGKTPEEKAYIYNQIIDIIVQYDEKTYPNLHLNENATYKDYLNNYQTKLLEINM